MLYYSQIWSRVWYGLRKIINNIPTIQPFKIIPIYQEVQKQPEPINNSLILMEELKALKAEIAKMKGGNNDAK